MHGMKPETKEQLVYRAKMVVYYARLACWRVGDFLSRRKAAKAEAAAQERDAKAALWASLPPQEQAAIMAAEMAKATAKANRPRQGCFSIGCCGLIILACLAIVAGALIPDKHHASDDEPLSLSRDRWVKYPFIIAAKHRETLHNFRAAGDSSMTYAHAQARSGEVVFMKQGDHVTELDVYVFDNISKVITPSGEVRFMFTEKLSSRPVPTVEEEAQMVEEK